MQPNYRRCISCRTAGPKMAVWRVVRVYPSQAIQLDEGMGRSAYLCRTPDCLQAAQKKNRLQRSLRSPVPPGIYEALWDRLQTEVTVAASSSNALSNEDRTR